MAVAYLKTQPTVSGEHAARGEGRRLSPLVGALQILPLGLFLRTFSNINVAITRGRWRRCGAPEGMSKMTKAFVRISLGAGSELRTFVMGRVGRFLSDDPKTPPK